MCNVYDFWQNKQQQQQLHIMQSFGFYIVIMASFKEVALLYKTGN